MRQRAALAAALMSCAFIAVHTRAQTPGSDEGAVRALAAQFVATQEREDAEAYLALWSPGSPSIDQMRRAARVMFTDRDFRLTNVEITDVDVAADRATVRVVADREVIDSHDTKPDGSRIVRVYRSLMAVVLTCAREEQGWRVWQEASAIRPLADALADAATEDERARLLGANPRLVSADLRALLANRADQLYLMQRFDEALSLLRLIERVAIEVGDRPGLASAYHNIGNVLYFKQQFDEAIELYRRRLVIEEELDNQDGRADAWRGVATAQYSQGDYLAALESYERARAIRETRDDQVALADLLVGIGNVHFLLGDYEPALDAYARARSIYERRFNLAQGSVRAVSSLGHSQIMRVLQGTARVRTAQGDYRSAVGCYEKALAIATTADDRPGQLVSLVSLAEVRYLQGRPAVAVELYRKAADLARGLGDVSTLARALAGIGLAELVRGRPAPAAEAYQGALAAHESRRDGAGMGSALIGLGYALAELDRFAEAVGSYDRAIALLTGPEQRDAAARALVGKAAALDGLGEHEQALDASERATAIAAALDSPDLAWRAAVRAGYAQRHANRPDAARAAFESAIATIERMRGEVGIDVPPPFLNDRADPYLAMVDLMADAGDARAVLEYAERARAQVRWDMLARPAAPITKGLEAGDRDAERALVHQIITLVTQTARARELPKPDPVRIAALEERLNDARGRYETFTRALQTRAPELVRWRGQETPLTAAAIVAAVPDDQTVLLQYVVTEEHLHVIAIERERLAHHTQAVGRKVLAARVASTIDPATLASLESWRGPARELSDLLLAPVRDAISGKTLVVVIPDGMLWRVPFEALEIPEAEPESGEPDQSFRPLLEQAAIVFASSATTWQYARALAGARVAAQTPPEVLAFGDSADWAELQAVADAYGSGRHAVHLGDEARESHARAEAPAYSALHVSAAGVVDHASPLHSRVQLTAAVRAETSHDEDDVIEAWELLNAAWDTDLVVCSAIDWPAGTLLGGDGIVGISWAWYVAGVPSVAVLRWATPSASRVALLGTFYRILAASSPASPVSRAEALREAARRVRRTPGMDSPLHWAGFMMVGYPE